MVNKTTWMVFEILDQVSKAKSRTDKIQILQKNNNNWAMKDILRGTFDDLVKWNLPTGKVPYEPADVRSVPSNLTTHNRKFAYFLPNTSGAKMPAVKREKMFLDILETVHPRDADLLVGMINKDMPIKGITKKLVKEAFPDLIVK
jgi:hypothetical protein|tara:strand:+ start:8772 stop:9206 length:435 start_codon:yes stop_codon:yes gene_type:complete